MSRVRASIITIGDELLIGQTTDTNSGWMAQQLNAIGIDVRRRVAIGDDREAMREAIDEEWRKSDILLLTGGLGPTADDITKPFLADYFGASLVVNEDVLAHVKSIFEKRKRPFLERNAKQAEVPDNCTVLPNVMGTAPGMWWDRDGKVLVSMPGVPFEMMGIMEAEVIPRLQQQYQPDAIVHRTIVTAGEGESFLAERIQDLEQALPAHIRLAYLPQPAGVRLRLTGHAVDELQLIREIELHRDAIAGRLDNIVVALEDLPLEHIIGKQLTALHKKLGLAESCTGGAIAHRITQIMGSAKYFQGSIVCYQEEIKQEILGVSESTIRECCVVSEEVARQMAAGARKVLYADYGFGVTGLLSPGGTDRVPVGTVCFAITDGEHTVSRTSRFHMDRVRNKELAVQTGMLLIWQFLNGKA